MLVNKLCVHCGAYHAGQCPRVAAIEVDDCRVEYHPPAPPRHGLCLVSALWGAFVGVVVFAAVLLATLP